MVGVLLGMNIWTTPTPQRLSSVEISEFRIPRLITVTQKRNETTHQGMKTSPDARLPFPVQPASQSLSQSPDSAFLPRFSITQSTIPHSDTEIRFRLCMRQGRLPLSRKENQPYLTLPDPLPTRGQLQGRNVLGLNRALDNSDGAGR